MKRMAVTAILLLAASASAEVLRVEISEREPLLSSERFGPTGSYEKIRGRVDFAIDPTIDPNLIITDVDKAPRDDTGRVRFSADFYLLKPVEMARANGTLLVEVANRGRKFLFRDFNGGEVIADPDRREQLGDGFLFRRGFTLLWVGWQWDTPLTDGLLRFYPPVATENGETIRGLVRSDFVPLRAEKDHSLADRNHIAYPVADPDAPENVLTVRDDVEAERHVIPRSQWRFARLEDGKVVDDPRWVYLDEGFQPHKIYEVVYVSQDPPVVGLGPAGIRDMATYIKHEGASAIGLPAGSLDRALAYGSSQSGRFLRTFLYHGFNEDERRRKVFDGMMVHVAGAGRGSFNHRFAQASRDGHPFLNFFYPTDIFPFTDREQIDFRTGTSGGLLVYARPETLPKIFYTISSYEYWGRAASLIHTSIDGREDVKLMDNVRIYHFAGTQHVPASFPPSRTSGQALSNPLTFLWPMRALLAAMDAWVRGTSGPPPSRYGHIAAGTLLTPGALDFPSIPGVSTERRPHFAYRADYGERFLGEGIVTKEPPDIGARYPILVPAVDADGNERAGIRLPEQRVPLATYTGWNPFNRKSGPVHVLASEQGSFIPFPLTSSERKASKDPRASIEERYASRDAYLGVVAEATLELIEAGYLLQEDMAPIVRQAGEHWDWLER
jgi:hypothetical protein